MFEFVSNNIGAQGTVCGGGRYDNLVESMGGKSVPAVGFGMGLERLIMVAENCGVSWGKRKHPYCMSRLWERNNIKRLSRLYIILDKRA